MHKSTRNTIASYSLFVYGSMLMLVLIVSLESEPTRISYGMSLLMGLGIAFFAGMLSASHSTGMHFFTRNILLFILLTFSEILIWYLICEGSFVLKNNAFN